jgi:hypothetical protein
LQLTGGPKGISIGSTQSVRARLNWSERTGGPVRGAPAVRRIRTDASDATHAWHKFGADLRRPGHGPCAKTIHWRDLLWLCPEGIWPMRPDVATEKLIYESLGLVSARMPP